MKKKEPSWGEIGKAIETKIEKEHKNGKCDFKPKIRAPGSESAVYGLGFLGALVYYLTTATDLWMGLFGIVKAILWPAFIVYELLKYLAM